MSGYEVVQSDPFPQVLFPEDIIDVVVACPVGKTVLGGGYQLAEVTDPFFPSLSPLAVSITRNGPSADGTEWVVTVVNPSATQFGQVGVNLNVICASVD